MPSYEFRCQSCGNIFEILVRPGEYQDGIRCTRCGAEGGERVLSWVSHSVAEGSREGAAVPETTTRTCSSGSCGTVTLPGHSR